MILITLDPQHLADSVLKGVDTLIVVGESPEDCPRGNVLKLVELEPMRNRLIKTYSKGMQQRVGLAQALINNPDVVLADEPSGNLDSKTAEELHQLFFNLRKEFNQTFVIVTHNTDLANMADRKLVMKDGNVI